MKLAVLLIVLAFCAVYGGFLEGLVKGGNWGWVALMFVWPFVLAWYVGNEEDRADFYKIKDWLAKKLRIR